jgi:hypothetical protein
MKVSRVVICLLAMAFFAKLLFGQQGSVARLSTLNSLTEHASTTPAPQPEPKVAASVFTVLVFNFRQVSTDILSNAEKEADQIFGHSGIQVVWQECPTGNEPCRIGSGPVFFLAIKVGPVQNKFLDAVSGQAIVANHLAVVYYDALPRVSRRKPTPHDASTLLACVIAHELGHLLLGAHGHSVHGIMRDRWDLEQTRVALMSELQFMPEEGKLMRRALLDGTTGEAAQPALVSSH